MKDIIKRISAGVVFESDVLQFIDQLASTQQRPRSFIINQIIRHYARMQQPKPQEGGTPAAGTENNAAALIRF